MSWIMSVARETWNTVFLAAPFILFGLFLAGVLNVLLSRRLIERWMGGMGLAAVATAACFGVPLPICSCSVVPVSIELKRKGASRPANMSFLITTPESSADAVLLTWGMFGWVMAVVRPIASFITGVVAGIAAIAWPEDGDQDDPSPTNPSESTDTPSFDDPAVGFRGLFRSITTWARGVWRKPLRSDGAAEPDPAPPSDVRPLRRIGRDIVRHAFVEMADDIAFWLVIGFVLTGVIATVVPDDLAARGLGSGLMPMLLMMIVGVPLYMCASASTPVAAALVAKGMSPGAALVFLLTGPATNAASVVLLLRHFGRRFVNIYLFSIALTSLACGLLLDAILGAIGYTVTARLTTETGGGADILRWACALALVGLLAWRLWKGALRHGLTDLRGNLEGLIGFSPRPGHESPDRAVFWSARLKTLRRAAAVIVAVGYGLSGFYTVPPDSMGYAFLFGRVVSRDQPPGLHYIPPAPIGRADVWRTHYPRKTDIGFRTDLNLLANRRELMRFANPGQWHSPVAAMNAVGDESASIAGDENLVDISLTVHYGLSAPYNFFYGLGKEHDLVSLYAQAATRNYIASHALDELLTTAREKMEAWIETELQARLDAVESGVRVDSVHIVDIHPPQDAVFAFRDVSSAREDRETRIHEAYERLAGEVPVAHGRAELELANARAAADSARTEAAGRAEGFSARAAAFDAAKAVLKRQLWLERSERLLAGREKFIVPGDHAGGDVILWRDIPSTLPAGGKTP